MAAVAYNAGLHNEAKLIQAVAFAWAESRFEISAETWCCAGYWQIFGAEHEASTNALLTSPVYNGQAMYWTSDGGNNWSPWMGDPEYGCEAASDCVPVAVADAEAVWRMARGPVVQRRKQAHTSSGGGGWRNQVV